MADLPAQVQAALDEAERIEQEMAAPPPSPEPEPPPAPEPVIPPAPEPVAPPPATPATEDVETWKAKYSTLQGMHRADVARLTAEVTGLKATVEDLTAQLAAKPKVTPPASALVTDKDAEAFGDDLIDLIGRKASEVAAPLQQEIEALKAENASLKGTVTTVATGQTANNQQRYYKELGDLVPDFALVNADTAFLQWLAQPDPLSGEVRQALLEDAFGKLDVTRTAAIFDSFKQTLPPPPPAPVPPKDDLHKQITPGSTRGGPAALPDDPTAKTFSATEIEAFYRDLARGEYKGREAEATRIEKEIDLAISSNRVTA